MKAQGWFSRAAEPLAGGDRGCGDLPVPLYDGDAGIAGAGTNPGASAQSH